MAVYFYLSQFICSMNQFICSLSPIAQTSFLQYPYISNHKPQRKTVERLAKIYDCQPNQLTL